MEISVRSRGVYLSVSALLLAGVLLTAGCGGDPPGPSVLLVIMQGARADHLSPFGYSRQTAPSLEALAEEGVIFERAYTSTPKPRAALASLLTGRFPPEHGLLLRPVLDGTLASLPGMLRERGYQTMIITADPTLAEAEGLLAGFETSEIVDPVSSPELDGGTAALTSRALEWLREGRESDRPFFLTLVYSSATLPYAPPEPFGSRFTEPWMSAEILDRAESLWLPMARRINSGELQVGRADLDVLGALYDGELGYLDSKLGEIFEEIRGAGIMDETFVVVTSDRGDDLGEGGHISDAGSLTEANLHVPLIIRGPGMAGLERRAQGLFQDVDLFPTLCALMGVAPPESVSDLAISQAPLDGAARRATAISVALRQIGPRVMDLSMSIRDDTHRYELGPTGPTSLLDLETDGGGLELLESSPAIANRLQAQLASWNGRLASPPGRVLVPPPAGPGESPEDEEPEDGTGD